MASWLDRLGKATADRGNLCVGIDPHPGLLKSWSLSDDASGVESFARGLIEAVGDQVAVFKPQSAFFEAHGPAGVAALARTLADIREAGALSLLDVKRGDIGSTMTAYARAYLDPTSELRADAITASPYLGLGSLAPALELAAQVGAGVYVLVRTSNPEGTDLQNCGAATGQSAAQRVVDDAAAWRTETGFDGIGFVIGATLAKLDVELGEFAGSILAPGIGAQGGRLSDLEGLFGAHAGQVLPAVSRAVLDAGPKASSLRQKVGEMVSV